MVQPLWKAVWRYIKILKMGAGRLGEEGLSKNKKGLMDMDNSVVIAGGVVITGLNGNGK